MRGARVLFLASLVVAAAVMLSFLFGGDDGAPEAPALTPEGVSGVPSASGSLMFRAYPEYSEGGYADRRTVLQGDSITFAVGNSLPKFSARVLRMLPRGEAATMREVEGLRGNDPRFGCTAEKGCDWSPTWELEVPEDWPSGWYRLEFLVSRWDDPRYVDFIVAEREPSARVLFVFDVQTALAYNVYGGASLYGGFDASGRWERARIADQVSFRRPFVRSHTYADAPRIEDPVWVPHEEEAFRWWLDERFDVAYVSNDALEDVGRAYLEQYALVVIAGTQEYWSNRQVELVESYVREGGNLYLSAIEFAYGAIRLEEDGEIARYFLDPRQDPLRGVSPDLVAIQRSAVSDLEEFFGVSLEHGQGLMPSTRFAPLEAVVSDHWAFEGTGILAGDVLTGVRGLGVGAWVERRDNGRYCIVSARIPCANVEVLAIAPYTPLNFPTQTRLDVLVDGRVDHTAAALPDETFAVVALIVQGNGTMFVGPGGWWNTPHANDWDPRIHQVIENVVARLSS